MNALRGELSKLRSLPSTWTAVAVGLAVPTAIAVLNSSSLKNAGRTSGDVGYQELAFGVVGAIILGVVVASSEYVTEGEDSAAGRQIMMSLTVVPSRTRLLAAKIAALTIATTILAAIASTSTLLSVHVILGYGVEIPRVLGIIVYWVLTSMLAFGITVLARNGIIPLAVLILNTSVVSVTFLLTKLTPLAAYFPDLAGARMFVGEMAVPVQLSPVVGGLVMAGWVVAVLLAGLVIFARRDA
ncbi:ABC transporter permease [Kibdelosporangium aridum]|uniref:ABC transporter permease n=1 Tax=Kibdelosporangium aridum TaxID=2030 RepID=A0A428ZUM0_KIBAR|nr:ABC transporter permease [Kibdelosporangium aridum]RSM91779.1 ABC transporter permease [Kibdelosporangium aridum]